MYRLGTSAPSAPTGGTSTEKHTPSGWSRTPLSPTVTQNVYRVQRTRTYTIWRWDDVVGHFGLDGGKGLDGKDGLGVEYVFTSSATDTQPPVGSRPLSTWTFDQPSIAPITIGQHTYYDGEPADLSATRPYRHRYSRGVPGQPAVGSAINIAWRYDGSSRVWGLVGDDGSRSRGDFYQAVTTSGWSDSSANAATPGDNVISDTVTLFQLNGSYVETRTWNGTNWIAVTQRIDGNILFPGSVTVNALAANSVNLGSGTVFGKLKVGNIESNVRTARILFKGTGNGTVIAKSSSAVFTLAQAFGDFDFLLFVVVNRPGGSNAIYGSFQISTDIIPSSNILTGEIGWVGGSSVHDNIGAKIWGSGSTLTLRKS